MAMHFETYPEWEIDNPSLKAHEKTQVYRIIEFSHPPSVLLVEVCLKSDAKDDDFFWKTYFVYDVDNVFELIDHEKVTDSRINLIVPRCYNENDEHGIYEIKKIFVGQDNFRNYLNIFSCANGKSFTIPAHLEGNRLDYKRCIYRRT